MGSGTQGPGARFAPLEAAAQSLGSALAARDLDAGTAAADAVVALTSDLLVESVSQHDADPEAQAELVAALHTYRNAAFAFRRFAKASGTGADALALACAELLGQGHDHLRRYDAHQDDQDR